MRGVVLSGGRGTRLKDLTRVVNKHLLPVYDRPMIYYPLKTLYDSGVRDTLIVTNPQHVGQFAELLGTYWSPGPPDEMRLSYVVQNNPTGGIAEAIGLADGFAGEENLLVILGDNIFEDTFEDAEVPQRNAMIFGKRVKNPEHYGVIETQGEFVTGIEEKPREPKSDLAQVGAYLYSPQVFGHIEDLVPSGRGELEVTDLNNLFRQEGALQFKELKGTWIDAGTSADSLLEASQLAKTFLGS